MLPHKNPVAQQLRSLRQDLARERGQDRALVTAIKDLTERLETVLTNARTAILDIRRDVEAIKTKVGA